MLDSANQRQDYERRRRAVALGVLAIGVSLGEGVGLGALALVAVLLADAKRRGVPMSLPAGALLAAEGIALWASAGAFAWVIGGYGVLDFGETGRWMSFTALALVPFAMSGLESKTLDRIATAYLVVVCIAGLFSLLTVALNARPGEWFVRGPSNGVLQGRMPFDASRTVAGGFYFHRLKFAHIATLGSLCLLVRQLTLRLPLRRRLLEGSGLMALLVALVLTYVRADLLGFVAGALVVGLFAGRKSRMALIVCVLVAAAAIASVDSLRERTATLFAAQASAERALIWSQGVSVIADHPFGVGLGNYSSIVGEYYDLVDPMFPTRTYSHSLWLTSWAEAGPLGLLGIVGSLLLLAWYAWRRAPEPHAVTLMACIVAFLTIGLAHDVFYDPPVALSFSSLLAFLATRMFRLRPAEPLDPNRSQRVPPDTPQTEHP